MKVINFGAMRWLRLVSAELPRGRFLRDASLKQQQEEIDFFRSLASLAKKKTYLRRV